MATAKKASKKQAPKKAAAKSSPKKAASKRAVKKAAASKTATKKTSTKATPTTKKAAATKPTTKKAAAKKPATKKATAKEAAGKTTAAKKTSAKRATEPAKKAAKKKVSKVKSSRTPVPKSELPAKFIKDMRERLIEERAKYLHSAEEYRAEADALMEGREPGDVQFDEESGEGDTLAVERERDLALSAQARQAVEQIDAALARIEAGTYGICVTTHQPIPQERLRAIPWAAERVEVKAGGIGRF